MEAWISKYALSKGIYKVEAEICKDINVEMIRVLKDKNGNKTWGNVTYHKGNWHLTQQEAINKAHKMREAKIKSYKKQIDKLKNLSF